MANPICVDLSHHNPEPDWAKLKAGGTLGVIMKATEGTTYIDNTFAARRERARAAGLAVSSYHFLKHGNAEQQMAHYLDVVGPVVGERVVIDHEDAKGTLSDLLTAVEALVRQPLDLQITVYSGHDDQGAAGHRQGAAARRLHQPLDRPVHHRREPQLADRHVADMEPLAVHRQGRGERRQPAGRRQSLQRSSVELPEVDGPGWCAASAADRGADGQARSQGAGGHRS